MGNKKSSAIQSNEIRKSTEVFNLGFYGKDMLNRKMTRNIDSFFSEMSWNDPEDYFNVRELHNFITR